MGVFTGFAGSNLATQLWISARYLQAISLLLAIFFVTRRLNYIIQFICYSIVTTLILLSIFYWRIFPVSYIEGSGLTAFKIVSEYIISFILLVTIFLLPIYRKEFNRTVFILVISSFILTILSEMFFTLYMDVFGFFNELGHFLKLASFFLIYKAIVETGFSQPFDLLFFKLKQREKDIMESEEKYHSLYSSMNEGACLHEIIYDENKKPVDYRIIDINDVYRSILGIKRNQIIGKKASEVYKTDVAPYINVYAKVADSGIPARFEAYFPPMKKYFLISAFSPSKGKFATIFSDITERKKNEMEIESLSRFPLENPNPVMRMDGKNSIIFANEPAKSMLQQLDTEKRNKFLKLLHDSTSVLNGKKNTKIAVIETKVGKIIYEFTLTHIKESDYFNIYGKEITGIKKAERMNRIITKEKALNEERNKLARELHDTVTQTLFSANLIADVITKLWKKDPEAVIGKLEEVRRLNNVALMEMRVLLYELRPSALKDESLGNLLQRLVKTISARSKIQIELIIDGEYNFPSKVKFSYYRIAQEALNNIIKHSYATRARMVLKSFPEELFMDISDNGRGFNDKKIIPTSLGLTIMRERAKLIGASISINNLPDKGIKITVIYNRKANKK